MSSDRNTSVLLFLIVGGVAAACATSSDSEGISGDAPPDGPPGAVLPPSSGGGSSGVTPASDGGKDSGGKPPAKDAAPDNAPPPPMPGTTCVVADKIFARECGACGKQEAICLSNASGKLEVSEYSACHDELVGGCTPGSIVDEACGNCGTHKKTCSKYCAWSVSACVGEPLNSCAAGTVAWSTAGCATSGTFRERSCSAACQWSSFASTCSGADFSMNAPAAMGATTSVIVPLTTAYRTKRVTGSCSGASGATLSPTDKHNVAFVRVTNTQAQNVTLSAWNSQAPGGALVNTVLVAYATQPTSDEELKACDKGAGDYCPTSTLPCGDSQFGALTGTSAVVVPAGGTRVIAITAYDPQGTPGSVTEGPILLTLRTDALE